ncbi:DUF1328 domain-containing protein [Halorubrum lipolyticum]|uniref:UPF0391 membrane protein C469_11521 n=1 Tax=Halorubrum lipolyticum DSM 21995 TaxID=1227482 RepID=M0NRJ5_9EURY|nr:DUF1328 domain-containing protein [Halorubrum lipolyticum]EMA59255.1 hypothetical protein C469_11521 [Halorubrum lipolyticum DSM 21995]
MDATIATAVDHQLISLFGQSAPLQFSGDFLQWAVIFFVIAIIAAVVGARGVAGISMTVAKWFVIIFLVLAVISIVL